MKEDNFLLAVAIAAVFVSLVAAGFTYFSMSNLVERITGYATGTVNLSVESTAAINFSTASISWGSGRVNPGASVASLTTFETNNVSGGNWTLVNPGGLRIENIGNLNVTLNLSGAKTAATLLGGTGPVYKWNITNVEASSCLNATGGTVGMVTPLNVFNDVNTTTVIACNIFPFVSGSDSIRIDFNLTVPENSLTGSLGDIITATATT